MRKIIAYWAGRLFLLMGVFSYILAGGLAPGATAEAARLVGDWSYTTQLPIGNFETDVGYAKTAGTDRSIWQPYDFPQRPPLQFADGSVWLTVHVTSENEDENTILFATTKQSLRVWLGDILVYEYGDVTSVRGMPGQRWHLITLPDFAGVMPLTFELHSGRANFHLGYLGSFSLGTKFGQARSQVLYDAPYLLSLPVTILIMMLLLTYYFNQSHKRGLFRSFILMLLFMIAVMVGSSNVKNIVLDNQVFWWYVTALGFYAIPFCANAVLYYVVDKRWRRGFRYIFGYYALVTLAAFFAELSGFDGIEYGKGVIYVSVITINAPAFYWVLRSVMNGNRYCLYIIPPTLGVVGPCTFDGLALHFHCFQWSSQTLPLGVYTFLVFLFYILRAQMVREMDLETKLGELQRDIAVTLRRSLTDQLTECPNKAAFTEYIHKHLVQDHGAQLVLIMFDIDHFKSVNDTYGHDKGDEVLKKFVAVLRRIVDTDGRVFRWGGEEFVVACEDMLVAEGCELAEGVRHAVMNEPMLPDRQVTVSAGVASWHGELDSPNLLFARMDRALYRAKQAGRNRVDMELETEIEPPKNIPASPKPPQQPPQLELPVDTLLSLIVAVVIGLASLGIGSPSASAAQLSGIWQYRVGNGSESEEQHMPWSAIHEPSAWRHLDFPEAPPLSEGTHVVWLTTTLTAEQPQADTLMFLAAHQAVRIWLDQDLIFSKGEFVTGGSDVGNQWELVILPQLHYRSGQLTFELYSHDTKYLGEFQSIGVDTETQQIQRLFWYDLPIILSLPIAVLMIIIVLLYAHINANVDKRLCQAIAVFLGIFALWDISASGTKSIFVSDSVIWWYALSVLAYLLPIAANGILYELLRERPYAHMKAIMFIYMTLFTIALLGEIMGLHTLNGLMVAYYPLLLICEGLAFIWLLHTAVHYHDRLCRAALVPTVAFALLGVVDGLALQFHLTSWHTFLTPFGVYAMVYFLMALFQENLEREHRLVQQTTGLEQQAQIASERSERDELTGCYNRLKLNKLLAAAIAESMDSDRSFSLIMFDIDHFKAVNDTYGHDRGDKILRGFAQRLQTYGGPSPCIRWGGEEFMVLCEGNMIAGQALAERLRMQVGFAPIDGLAITASAGVAYWHGDSDTAEALFKRVDDALYLAKNSGRNRVCTELELESSARKK